LPLAPVFQAAIVNPFVSQASDDNLQRKLRETLRNILARIKKNRKYEIFLKPINECMGSKHFNIIFSYSLAVYPDYFTIVVDPIDLGTISNRVDSRYYRNFSQFREDLDLMLANTKLFYVKNQKKALNRVCFLLLFFFFFYSF
jgi:hypothetical protein